VLPNDIEITTEDGVLTLKATRRNPETNYLRRFTLPEDAASDQSPPAAATACSRSRSRSNPKSSHAASPSKRLDEEVVILGGTGFVGTSLVTRWARAGHEITLPSRDPSRARHLAVLPTVRVARADVHDPATLARLFRWLRSRHQSGRHPQRAR
jgi:hypothetical protein